MQLQTWGPQQLPDPAHSHTSTYQTENPTDLFMSQSAALMPLCSAHGHAHFSELLSVCQINECYCTIFPFGHPNHQNGWKTAQIRGCLINLANQIVWGTRQSLSEQPMNISQLLQFLDSCRQTIFLCLSLPRVHFLFSPHFLFFLNFFFFFFWGVILKGTITYWVLTRKTTEIHPKTSRGSPKSSNLKHHLYTLTTASRVTQECTDHVIRYAELRTRA